MCPLTAFSLKLSMSCFSCSCPQVTVPPTPFPRRLNSGFSQAVVTWDDLPYKSLRHTDVFGNLQCRAWVYYRVIDYQPFLPFPVLGRTLNFVFDCQPV